MISKNSFMEVKSWEKIGVVNPFCGGSVAGTWLRKGEETQPTYLNHHMGEEAGFSMFFKYIETV